MVSFFYHLVKKPDSVVCVAKFKFEKEAVFVKAARGHRVSVNYPS